MFSYFLFICLIYLAFNVNTIEGYKWIIQNNYFGPGCNSSQIDYVIMFLMGKCTQDSPTTSFIEQCYNDTNTRNYTYYNNPLCQGEPVSGKFFLNIIVIIKFSFYFMNYFISYI